jgi:hypothetical protein
METQRDARVLDRFGPPEDKTPTSCVLVYYDLLGLRPPLPLRLYAKEGRIYKEDPSRLQLTRPRLYLYLPNLQYLSIICLFRCLGRQFS